MANNASNDASCCEWCFEPLDGKSQKEHDAECPYHPCFDCNDENTEECLRCPYSK